MNSEQNLIQFWEIVKACLTELYKMPDEAATKAIQRLWSRGPKGVRVIPSARNLVTMPILFILRAIWPEMRFLARFYGMGIND